MVLWSVAQCQTTGAGPGHSLQSIPIPLASEGNRGSLEGELEVGRRASAPKATVRLANVETNWALK